MLARFLRPKRNEAVSRNGPGFQVLFLVRREMKYAVRLVKQPWALSPSDLPRPVRPNRQGFSLNLWLDAAIPLFSLSVNAMSSGNSEFLTRALHFAQNQKAQPRGNIGVQAEHPSRDQFAQSQPEASVNDLSLGDWIVLPQSASTKQNSCHRQQLRWSIPMLQTRLTRNSIRFIYAN